MTTATEVHVALACGTCGRYVGPHIDAAAADDLMGRTVTVEASTPAGGKILCTGRVSEILSVHEWGEIEI